MFCAVIQHQIDFNIKGVLRQGATVSNREAAVAALLIPSRTSPVDWNSVRTSPLIERAPQVLGG